MAVSREYYKALSAEEFVMDDYFVESIKNPSQESQAFWEAFLSEYPQQLTAFDTAGSLIKQLKFRQDAPATGSKERIWNAVHAAAHSAPVRKLNPSRRWIWAAAASILIVAALSITWWRQSGSSRNLIQTQYGEVRQLVLPDQSVVTLNAHSTLEFKKDWKEGEPREVWLKGEGFFEVKHLNVEGQPVKASDRFIVHAGNANVEVLGTVFNVSDRQSVTQVVLQSGKVRVDFKDKKAASVVMKPGELVKYDKTTQKVVQEEIETNKYTSWKKKEFQLDNTSVRDLIGVIENTYGYKVEVDDNDLLNRQISGAGTISLEKEEDLFKSLEVILNVEIQKKDDSLFIKSK